MSTRRPCYTAEETARRGDEIYDRVIRANVAPQDHGKIVAIDVDTEAFEIGENAIDASDKLLKRVPDAEIWFVRIGHSALHRIGGIGPKRQ